MTPTPRPTLTVTPFGVTRQGEPVRCHTLTGGGVVVRCLDYGGAIQSLEVPDREGVRENVVLGYDDLEGYERDDCWCGVLCGPVAGRIAGAAFDLDGVRHVLEPNDGAACLHGGATGFSRRVWRPTPFVGAHAVGVRFSLVTAPGEGGFPGPLAIEATYALSSDGTLSLSWKGSSPVPVVLAPTFHGYFNLGGPRSTSIQTHRLRLDADRYMPLDEAHLPRPPVPVEGTPFDFRSLRPVGPFPEDPQILRGAGYDHAFVFGPPSGSPQGVLEHPQSGRRMIFCTDEPCAVLYTGGFLSPHHRFSRNRPGKPHLALALEPQWFPNALGLPDVPSPQRPPGTPWRSRSSWRFSTTASEIAEVTAGSSSRSARG